MKLKEVVESYNVERIVGYPRRSRQDLERERRTGEDTLTEQIALLNKILASLEIPYDLEPEIGSGETIEGRPVFKRILIDMENGKYQAICVKELARLSRGDYSDAGRIIDIITKKRIIIITPYKVYDPRNKADMRQIRFELFLAREEFEMIRERMVSARYTNAAQGKWVSGKAPYGYIYNKHTQKLEPHEEQSKVIKMIYDMFLNGYKGQDVSYQFIASHLTKLGIRTARGRKVWKYIQIKQILENETYKGVVKFGTTEVIDGKKVPTPKEEHIYVEDAHEPIIDKETWSLVQDKIRNKKPEPHNPLDFEPNELAGVCVCSECGGKLIRNCGKSRYKKKDGTVSIYVKEFLKCQNEFCMSVKYRDVEKAILHYLEILEDLDDQKLSKVIKNNLERQSDGVFSREETLKQIEEKERELKARLEFIFEKFEQGIYDDNTFIERRENVKQELINLQAERLKLEEDDIADEQYINIDNIRTNISNLAESYKNAKSKSIKNEILRTIFKQVEVKIIEKGSGRRSARFEITPIIRQDITSPL